ncbi:protein ADM2 isoform X4 [Rhinolophus sinicus]|uniref:protein ADM2 isoform X4 n=1 Tax=Rhinolophus sinicus TaxID=89399 RepID=UPI003D7A51D0
MARLLAVSLGCILLLYLSLPGTMSRRQGGSRRLALPRGRNCSYRGQRGAHGHCSPPTECQLRGTAGLPLRPPNPPPKDRRLLEVPPGLPPLCLFFQLRAHLARLPGPQHGLSCPRQGLGLLFLQVDGLLTLPHRITVP